ncbi:MAG TPA: MFS transporter [Pseudonocardiaceae bacterium]|jgi:CP family cyanate transporter-like MFS transporter|nr:MFS transporter [Pseudonocardiaceae bacterium]
MSVILVAVPTDHPVLSAPPSTADVAPTRMTVRDRRSALLPTGLLVAAILLVAGNLRPVVTSLGSVLDLVHGSLHTSSAWVSVLTALPGLCFGLAGFLAPLLARRLGLARAIGLAMLLLTVGALVRVLDGASVVLGGTLVACAGIAVCNVLIPVVVKQSYPHRIGLITGLYTAVLQGAAALGSFLTPITASAAGGWRPALGQWGLLAVLGTLGWVAAARHGGTRSTVVVVDDDAVAEHRVVEPTSSRRSLWRNPLAWTVTAFFGLQSMFAYEMMGWAPQVLMSAGVSRGEAGAMLAVMGVLGVPLSLLLAPLAARQRSQSGWLVGLTLLGAIGIVGLLVAPGAAPWLWSVTVGVGMGVFAIAVALIPLRTKNSADTQALSTMVQGVGYLLAAVGPFAFGLLHGSTGGWTASLTLMLAGVAVQAVFGWLAGRPRYI